MTRRTRNLASSRLWKHTANKQHKKHATQQVSRCEQLSKQYTAESILQLINTVKKLVPAAWTPQGVRGVVFLNSTAGFDSPCPQICTTLRV